MNRMVAQQLKEIAKTIDELKQAAAVERERFSALAKSRNDLQRKLWSQAKEMHVLGEQIETLPEFKRENDQFQKAKADLEERLRNILACTRALSAEFRS